MNGEFQKRRTAFKIPIGALAKGKLEFERNADDPNKEHFRTLVLDGKEIYRISIVANIIDSYQNKESSYAALTMDDSTGTIRIKAFSDSISLIKEITLGDTILVIGTLRYFNNELYILPEIIKQLDPRWLLVRKLELTKNFNDIYEQQQKQEHKTQAQTQTTKETVTEAVQTSPASIQKEEIEEEVKEEKIITEPEGQKQTEQKNQENLSEIESESSPRDQILKLIKEAETEEGIDIDKIIMQLTQPVEEIKSIITKLLEEGTIYEPRPGRLRIL